MMVGRGSSSVIAVESAPPQRQARRGSRPSWVLRAKVALNRGGLERLLANGATPERNAALELRASQLLSMSSRRRLAADLRRVLARAEAPGPRSAFSAVVIDCAGVRKVREGLLGLADLIEGHATVSPRGLALARVLLTDVHSPLFDPCCEHTIIESLWRIEEALTSGVSDQIAI
jgi:hypothetical protein